ncbi:hypothetical protein N0V83_005648 [Neocucurbitaria cava]|uniref:chitinase n=1 Tax=Neocucurbitaria cava TaxID=798079 RepID=A0A9W8Y8D9_9PLEO|nr:hypothetical protein N0V83_005648 [Neocucurbitaria cava]
MNSYDTDLYPRVTALKKMNSGLKVFIAVGGWAAGGAGFSRMVSSPSSRSTFIQSALSFMRTYNFDGIDIDWEYPAAGDRDGTAADKENFVTFMQELKDACGATYGVTATLPSSYWYMKGFDIIQLEKHVDWFNFMSYDIHGTWDGSSPYTQAVVQPHTNLTEISQGLDLLWRNKINPAKVVLGLGFYGRSFTLSSSSCTTPGCAFSGGADAGECTKTSGILSNAEIQRLIKAKSLKPILDKEAGVKVSYDDEETLQLKKDFANKHCLGGTMVWALDLDDASTSTSLVSTQLQQLRDMGDDVDLNLKFAKAKLASTQKANNIGLATFWTDCQDDPQCPQGFTKLTLGHGKVFDSELNKYTADGCKGGPKGYMRALCVESNVVARDCDWYGKPKKCGSTCPAGYLLISQNTHPGGSSRYDALTPANPISCVLTTSGSGCKTGYFSSYCCSSIEASNLMDCSESAAGKALSGGLNLRAKNLGTFQNALGKGDADWGTLAECAAEAYNDGTVGELAALGVFSAGLYVLNHVAGHWVQNAANRWIYQPLRNLRYPSSASAVCTTTVTSYVEETRVSDVKTVKCDGNKWPNACYHYSSVSRENGLHTLVCPNKAIGGSNRPAVNAYRADRANTEWFKWVSNKPAVSAGVNKCNRDEYPPFRFLAAPNGNPGVVAPANYDQWIRFLPQSENGGAGQLWNGLCDKNGKKETKTQGGPINGQVCTEIASVTYKVKAMSMDFTNLPYRVDDGMPDNWCNLVATLRVDYGFNLLNADPWYNNRGSGFRGFRPSYLSYPPSLLTMGKTRPRNTLAKRLDSNQVDLDETIVDEGNSTRLATPEELLAENGLYKCQSENCEEEKELLNEFIIHLKGAATGEVVVEAVATLGPAEPSDGYTPSRSRKTGSASMPVNTAQPDALVEAEHDEAKHRRRHGHGHGHGHAHVHDRRSRP